MLVLFGGSGPTGMSDLLRRKGVKDSPYTLPAVHTLVLCLSSTEMEESWVRTCSYYVASIWWHLRDKWDQAFPVFLHFSSSSVHYCEHKQKNTNGESLRTRIQIGNLAGLVILNMALNSSSLMADFSSSVFQFMFLDASWMCIVPPVRKEM